MDLGAVAHHIPNTKTAKEMVELLDFNLLTKEEIDDMKIIAKKINASGKYCFGTYAVIFFVFVCHKKLD